MTKSVINGATFSKKSAFFRPTAMSVAMFNAGIIPGTHMVKEQAHTVVVRNRNDNLNQRPSVHITL